MAKYKIFGKFNELKTKNVGNDTLIGNFNYIGENVVIGEGNKIHNHINIYSDTIIGDDNVINPYCIFNTGTKIGSRNIFGANVMTADEVKMTPYTDRVKRKPCMIGDGNKIGQGAMLISIEIGNDNIIGAGAVCLENIKNGEVWMGIPAKLVRKVTADEVLLSRKDGGVIEH